jgi:hypothetical protein
MLKGLRSRWLAGGGAVLLVLSISGIAAGATLVADTAEIVEPAEPPDGTTDTTLTFEDVDGDGVDDDCQDVAAEADAEAVTAALLAADLDGDGTISVSEAAQTDWIGGPNCNHGGYVSWVAHGADDACDEAEASEETEGSVITPVIVTEESEETEDAAACDEEAEEEEEETEDAEQAECEAAVEDPATEEPAAEEETDEDAAPNAHGKAVSELAGSDAVGGKNCNHGGAVSELAKDKDHGNAGGDASKKAAGKGHGKGHGKGPKH